MDKDAKIPGKPILDVGLPRNKTAVDELPPPGVGCATQRGIPVDRLAVGDRGSEVQQPGVVGVGVHGVYIMP